jgi:thiol-disulfide isomerase/thioredoxin
MPQPIESCWLLTLRQPGGKCTTKLSLLLFDAIGMLFFPPCVAYMPAVLTILWLPWPFFFLDSGPCKAIAPLYEELSEEFDGGKCLACI